ncbi:MAG: dihydrofolate reductase [Gammaproteobacteria bacterium]|nr:dihydrofolate reductase [Gammaproteobacteria bacterium]
MQSRPMLSLVSAMDSNRLIGKDNALPWHLPADLAFFKRTTMGKPIIMGRKTFASIGKALPGRQNIVVTRNPEYDAPGCDIAPSLEQATRLAGNADEVMLIGGASLYEQAIDSADCIYLTLIHHVFSGDTWFPEINTEQWNLVSRKDFEADGKNPYQYSFIKFVREIRPKIG